MLHGVNKEGNGGTIACLLDLDYKASHAENRRVISLRPGLN
jgi:hypothetical protein